MKNYDHKVIEQKWRERWAQEQLFYGWSGNTGEKLYLLFAFPYPSGAGLHVGHVESMTALDILARYHRMRGRRVFFPMGWDAFGLPAENFAIKTGVPPAETTAEATGTFTRQIKDIGISYQWDTEVATCHPGYYKWTQWLFLELYKAGLAYRGKGMVNWCPSCQTVLANEQVVNGVCERCGTHVVQKELEQWFFKITDYAEELISGLDQVDWPKATKEQQLNWIGKKEGINIHYPVEGLGKEVVCFTTRPDTNFGATFIVIAPEHPLVKEILKQVQDDKKSEIASYVEAAVNKREVERIAEGKRKTGVFTGFYGFNRLNNKKLPIYISDFVLKHVGTGAVVGVPGHDKRDFEFAQAMNLLIVRVVAANDGDTSPITSVDQVQEAEGVMMNSEFLNGMDIQAATQKMIAYHVEKGWGERVVTYKLRDWLISRQRYWGAPIPIVYDPEGKPHPVKGEHLPWMLPTDVEFRPKGKSPLTYSKEFKTRVEKLYGKGWRPEYDTMDTFVDSSWYFLRYPSVQEQKERFSHLRENVKVQSSKFKSNSKLKTQSLKLTQDETEILGWDRDWSQDIELPFDRELTRRWLPVDFYMIGPEHIVLHLLYSRFFTKFLRDRGYLAFDEPFVKMRHQGIIMGPDHHRMSKSRGNVINPDEIIKQYGADTLRIYEMFMGPIEADKPWSVNSVRGGYRFLKRVFRLFQETSKLNAQGSKQDKDLRRRLHSLVKKVGEDIESLKFNTAIAAMMEFLNDWEASIKKRKTETGGGVLSTSDLITFLLILAPFAPYLAEELWQKVRSQKSEVRNQKSEGRRQESVHQGTWPKYDERLVVSDLVTVVVQVNGKKRAYLSVPADGEVVKERVVELAAELPEVAKWLSGKDVQKTVWVAPTGGRQGLVNFVVI